MGYMKLDLFLQKAIKKHGLNNYNYKTLTTKWWDINYKNTNTKIEAICAICNYKNYPTISNHFSNPGCLRCSGKLPITREIFLERVNNIHNNKYKYNLITNILWEKKDNINIFKVPIICDKHGIFHQTINNHMNIKNGCPICNESKGEKVVREYLEENNIIFNQEYRFSNFKRYSFDFYIEDSNLVIEYDGEYHYKEIKNREEQLIKTQERDKMKNKYCKDNGINIIRIPYWDINKIENILEGVTRG